MLLKIRNQNGTFEDVEVIKGQDGAIQYTAGSGISIVNNVISAISGTIDYIDLTNKPKINNVELSGNKTTGDLGISYNDLTNKPTIPIKTSDLTNDSNFATTSYVNSRISDYINISSSPLTKDNNTLVDSNLQNARYVIAFYTVLLSGLKYTNSTIISVNRNSWNVIYENGVSGHVKVEINGAESKLMVSIYSQAEFGILGYTIVY